MYGIGLIQLHPKYVDEGPAHESLFWNREEKHAIVDAFGNNTHPTVYVVDKHAGGEQTYDAPNADGYFEIPLKQRLGRVVDAMCDKDGNLHGQFELFYENQRAREIMKEIESGKKYGLSVGVNTAVIPGHGRVVEKRFQHLGLTMDPEYGDPNDPGHTTWIHQGRITYDSIDDIIDKHYLSREGMYASKRTRDRIAARKEAQPPHERPAVAMTIGASRSPTNSPPLIQTTAKSPGIAPSAKPASQMSLVNTTMTTGGVVIPTQPTPVDDPMVTEQQQQQQQPAGKSAPLSSAERDRKNELELQNFIHENRAFIDGLVGSEDSQHYKKAVVLHDQLENLLADPSILNDRAKRTEVARVMSKMSPYIDNINKRLSEYVTAQKLEKKDEMVLSEMIKFNGTDAGFGPVFGTILASADTMNNMRVQEAALRKEVDDLKKRARDPEPETRHLGVVSRQSVEQDNGRYGQQPSQTVVHSTAGATRYNGSTIARSEHTIVDQHWGDTAHSPDAYRNTPFSRTTFDPETAKHLAHISSVSKRLMASGSCTATGIVNMF